jgi:hypothetical protein
MANPSRIAMMQKSMARIMRKKSSAPHREPDPSREPDMDADDAAPKFKRTGSISSAGASVGGGT